jgi:hypothetical protein
MEWLLNTDKLSQTAQKAFPKFDQLRYTSQLVEALRYKPEGRGFDSR